MKTKKGLLLINLGTPDDPGYLSVFKYLRQFLMDPKENFSHSQKIQDLVH